MGRLVTLLSPVSSKKVIAQDSFNRADNTATLGTTSGGQTWLAPFTFTFGILSNRAYISTGAIWGFDLINLAVSDFIYECDMEWASGNNGVLIFRSDGTNNNRWILQITQDPTNNFNISKTIAGGDIFVAGITFAPVSGATYRLKVECKGSVINGYLNGSPLLTTTDTALQTNTMIGIGAYTASGVPSVKWDNLIVYA